MTWVRDGCSQALPWIWGGLLLFQYVAPIRNVALPQGILYFLESLKQRQTSMRVLVLEDDPKIASFLEKGLTQSGFAVDVCEDGEEGLIRVMFQLNH